MTTQQPQQLRPDDFDIDEGTPLGCGAIAMVNRCRHKPSGTVVAVKVLSKLQLLQMKKVEAIMAEKEALYALGPHAGIVYLYGTMQTEDELYFVLDLLPNGDLLEHIRRVEGQRRMYGDDQSVRNPMPCLHVDDVRLITAQIVLCLAHVFSRGYVLRDLKPENICFDADGRVVLIDFDTVIKSRSLPVTNGGVAIPSERPGAEPRVVRKVSEIQDMRRQSSTFAGTAHYVSPETLGENINTYASDLFALGCVVFHMLAARPVFNGASSFFVMRDIKQGVAAKTFPAAVTQHPGAEDFIRQLLAADPARRLGVNRETGEFDLESIQRHSFFSGFDWSSAAYPAVAAKTLGGGSVVDKAAMSEGRKLPPPRYRDAPRHSDEYAAYVFQAGDSAFERFAEQQQQQPLEPAADVAPAADDGDSDDAGEGSGGASGGGDAEDRDDVVSIEDDVGVASGAVNDVEWRGGFAGEAAEDDGDEGATRRRGAAV